MVGPRTGCIQSVRDCAKKGGRGVNTKASCGNENQIVRTSGEEMKNISAEIVVSVCQQSELKIKNTFSSIKLYVHIQGLENQTRFVTKHRTSTKVADVRVS